jgi:GxxExxY protein
MRAFYKENDISGMVVDTCIRIHKLYGPGLFESVYEEIFCYEWHKEGIPYERQKAISVVHETIKLDVAFRADIIIDNKVLLEFKSVEKLAQVHYKQVLTYLKLTGIKLGMLINFNEVLLKDGIHRIINGQL